MALAESAGLVLHPWQRLALDRMLGERDDGSWSAFEAGLLVARQNGKGCVLEARVLAGLYLFGEQLIIWTAHEFKTAREAFRRVRELIEGSPHLLSRVKRRGNRLVGIRESSNDLSITLESGQRLRFLARSRASGRGFSADVVIFDEAQDLSLAAVEAAMPTTTARPNPQVIYAGSAPGPEDESEQWEALRDRGRVPGGDPGLVWLEWSPDGDPDQVDPDDLAATADANPGLGYVLSLDRLMLARAAMSPGGYCREHLTVWHGSRGRAAIPSDVWAGLVDAGSQVHGRFALAIDMPPDRSSTAIAVAGRRVDGLWHVEVVDFGSGSGWVVERVAELHRRWRGAPVVVDGKSPAASLLPALKSAGVEPFVSSMAQLGAACGAFYDAVIEGKVRHRDQVPLTVAVSGATWRPLGDSRAWARKGAVDISPLVAVTLAMLGVEVVPIRKGGKVW